MRLSLFHTSKNRESAHAKTGEGIAGGDPYATHFEQLMIPSFGGAFRTSFRKLLWLGPRKR